MEFSDLKKVLENHQQTLGYIVDSITVLIAAMSQMGMAISTDGDCKEAPELIMQADDQLTNARILMQKLV